ncbi:uncharacterized protein SPPG_01716 [Spizellomyces punctatus DAOM BR117]|uniref:F-box domain-containing protein n=1 Tax=Spizellomyces punctatus (strain DAOM BR117) TaxID=645134 RepID=A0A0L0HNH6_SPIPD|nr:uncharacterized protein SPPG_01716 [Spizellomyces punctatus DAOM BR117]KND02627.1 hypothetical protein SPPG_01716 [Spizellomyces punctatus DAOM BR117]|eukprot:XP_016610666.1 hypothetical protein SPPG_01716 [Spizellomyces punctatus DAOM BR117]
MTSNAAIDVVHALESLSTSLTNLHVSSPSAKCTVLSDDALYALLRWLDPLEYHVIAPLVCKQWWRCVRMNKDGTWRPRVVLMNLVLWTGEGASAGQWKEQCSKAKKQVQSVPKTTITRPLPLEYWTVLPKSYAETTGSCMAGEGVTVCTTVEHVPVDRTQLGEYLNAILGMLLMRVNWSHPLDDTRRVPNVSIVPWQITLPQGLSPRFKEQFVTLLKDMCPRVVEMHFPPRDVVEWLTPVAEDLWVLRLGNIRKEDPVEWDNIGKFTVLKRLEINGAANEPKDTAKSEINLAALSLLSHLCELHIGPNYALPDPAILLPLTSLRILSIPPQTPCTPDLVLLLKTLDTLYGLTDPTPSFWTAVPPSPPLTLLSIVLTDPTLDTLRETLGSLSVFPRLKFVTIKPANLTSDGVLGVLKEFRGVLKVLGVRIEGVAMRVKDVGDWAAFNLVEEGFKVRWKA